MNKRGLALSTVIRLALLLVAFIIILNFVKTKSLYASGIFSNIFGKVNESIGGVSWDDLTKDQRDRMTDQQKAEAMFLEVEKSLNLGIERRNEKKFDDAKDAFDKALQYIDKILALSGITGRQQTRAKALRSTILYYLNDLKTYEGVVDYLERAKEKDKTDEALKILKECEEKYPRSVRSVDCIVTAYLRKADLMDKTTGVVIEELNNWLNQQISSAAKGDQSKIAHLHLAAGDILYQLSLVPNADRKALLEEAIRHYAVVTNDANYKDFYDYIGRAYYRKAQIYKNFYEALGINSDASFTKSAAEYDEMFKKLGGRDFLDKQEALQEQKIASSRCFKAFASKDREGQQTISVLGIYDFGDIYFHVVTLDARRCPLSGLWQFKVYLKKDEISKEIFDAQPFRTSDPKISLLNDGTNIRGESLQNYDKLLLVAYKADRESDRATLELQIAQ